MVTEEDKKRLFEAYGRPALVCKESGNKGSKTFDNPIVQKSFENLKKIVKEKNIDVMKLFS